MIKIPTVSYLLESRLCEFLHPWNYEISLTDGELQICNSTMKLRKQPVVWVVRATPRFWGLLVIPIFWVSEEEISFLICEYRGRNSAFGYLLCSCTGRGGSNLCTLTSSGLPAPSIFYTREKWKTLHAGRPDADMGSRIPENIHQHGNSRIAPTQKNHEYGVFVMAWSWWPPLLWMVEITTQIIHQLHDG